MLLLFSSCQGLRFNELMEVYLESNRAKTSVWHDLPPMFALELAERDFRQYLEEVFFHTPEAVLAVWEESAKYVSALRLEPYKDGLLLEGLETAPEERKLGYAASLLKAVQGHLATQGPVKLYSHVHKTNIPSMRTHEACGFKRISDHAVYINGNVDYRCYTLLYEG